MAVVGRGLSTGNRRVAVWAWPVPWAPCGRRGGVAGPLGPVWQPWGCYRSPERRVAAMGRGLSPGNRRVAVGAWPVFWALLLSRWGVDGPLQLVWPPWGSTRFPGLVGLPLGHGRFAGFRRVFVGAWPVA